jgi:transcriptional regulator with GAF, ATPase, and Fis domain
MPETEVIPLFRLWISSNPVLAFGRRAVMSAVPAFRIPIIALVVAIIYYAGSKIGFLLTPPYSPISTFWPPNAVLLGILLLTPLRIWWVLVLAVLPAHLFIQLRTGIPVISALGWFAGNTGEALLGATCIRLFKKDKPLFRSSYGAVVFLAFGVLVPTFVTSFLDAGGATLTGLGQNYWTLWKSRLTSNIVSDLTIVPIIVIFGMSGMSWFRRTNLARYFEAGLLAFSVVAVSLLVFSRGSTSSIPAFIYAPLLLLLWAAGRFGCGGLSASMLAIALVALWNTVHGQGPLGMQAPVEAVISLRVLLIVFAVPLMLLAALLAERQDDEETQRILATDIENHRQAEDKLRRAFEEIKQLRDQLGQENLALKERIDQASMFEEIVGSSDALHRVLLQVERVAPTDSTVLIMGETGTGKELIAHAIHKRSKRAGQAFISVNCASIPTSLIASELFGHEKGAFTGALQRRQGRFELAHGGTIFLDEVGALPLETQIALLRVLQERQFERVGGNRVLETDARVITATNRNLVAAIDAGAFRADLFYRLNVFPIEVPALRQRTDDIPVLVEYFVRRYAQKAGKRIKNIRKRTLELFQTYDWPGNVRELQNVVERAVVLSNEETFFVDESWLKPPLRQQLGRVSADRNLTSVPLVTNLLEREKEIIENALREAEGVVGGPAGAAAKLGIPRETLNSKIRKLGIKRYLFKRS